MRVVVVTKDNTDCARTVREFLENFVRQTGRSLEVLDPETPEGDSFCRTYDVVEYPSVVALSNDGQMQHMWRGTILPTVGEVSYYAGQD